MELGDPGVVALVAVGVDAVQGDEPIADVAAVMIAGRRRVNTTLDTGETELGKGRRHLEDSIEFARTRRMADETDWQDDDTRLRAPSDDDTTPASAVVPALTTLVHPDA